MTTPTERHLSIRPIAPSHTASTRLPRSWESLGPASGRWWEPGPCRGFLGWVEASGSRHGRYSSSSESRPRQSLPWASRSRCAGHGPSDPRRHPSSRRCRSLEHLVRRPVAQPPGDRNRKSKHRSVWESVACGCSPIRISTAWRRGTSAKVPPCVVRRLHVHGSGRRSGTRSRRCARPASPSSHRSPASTSRACPCTRWPCCVRRGAGRPRRSSAPAGTWETDASQVRQADGALGADRAVP
jgi:hypothetical protein